MIISIHLDGSEENIFHPGQNVSGHVRVEVNEEIKMRGIRLEVNGYATVHWDDYTGYENFIDLKTYLIGSDDKDSEMMLRPGVHTLPVSFLLPDTAPSSFEGLLGSVRYRVKAVVDRPMKIDDSTEIPLTVIRWLNLKNEPQLMEPIEVKGEKPMVGSCYYLCFIRGLPEIELTINKGGFAPGETIVLSGHVINRSNTPISETTIDLVQEIEYCITTHAGKIYGRRFLNTILSSKQRPSVECGQRDTWRDVTFDVPYVTESRLDGCSIINITYYIQVQANFSRGLADSTIRREIVIGHIPLEGSFQCGGPITTQPSTYRPTSSFES